MKPYRDRPYLNLSYRDKTCLRCGVNGCEPCHYSGLYSDQLGKGGAQKSSDACVADLCRRCHEYFDQYKGGNDDARAAEFLLLCWRTLIRNLALGLLRFRVTGSAEPAARTDSAERVTKPARLSRKRAGRVSQCVAGSKTFPRRGFA